MSSLSVDRETAVASCSTSRSVGALSHFRQSPTTSIKSAGTVGFRGERLGSNSTQVTRLEEDAGTNKSGMVTGFMAFTKSGKKTYYAILSDRCFELHDNQKSYKKKKAARHIFDLATCFNINRHEDAKLKTCVSIMTPDETFIFKAAEEDKQRDDKATLEWFDAMMTAVVPARALHLGRPVLATEFFEYCWDVVLVTRPRIRKPVPNPENFENICTKRPELATRHRLGFYAHTIILCKMGTQPAVSGHPKSGIPPFKTDNFIEIQRQFVASFGFQEKYFIMRIGRAAATGMCEIWAQCESEEVAANIHSRLNEIIEREAEKKRQNQQQQKQPSTPSSTHQLLSSPQNHSKDPSTSSSEASNSPKIEFKDGAISEIPSTSSISSRKSILRNHHMNSVDDEEVPPHLETQKVVFNRSTISAKSIDQAILRDITRHEQKAVETQRAHTIGSPSLSASSWLNMLRRGGSQKKDEKNKSQFPISISPVIEWPKHRASLSGSSAPDDETEDSGGTLKVVDYEETDVRSNQPILVNGMFPHERLIEAALESHGEMSYYGSSQRGSISSSSDHDINTRKRQMTIGSDSGKGEDLDHDIYNRSTPDDSSSIAADDSSLSDVIGCQRHFDEACSTSSSLSDHPEKASNSSGSVSHLLPPPTSEQHLEDVRSYVSDSSDSCYSSINANPYLNPRAFSFSNNIVRNQGSAYEMMQPSKYPTFHGHRESKYSNKNSPVIHDEGSSSASTDGIQLGEEAATTAVSSKSVRIQEGPSNQFLIPKDDLRKRAFSLGSPSWIIKPFKKLSHTPDKSNRGSKSSSIAGDDENESIASHRSHPETSSSSKLMYSMMEKRSDSVDSSSSHPSRKLSSTMKKKQNDLVEVNFSPPATSSSIIAQYNAIGSNKHSKDSVDSPIRSRASSFATHRSNNSGKNSVCGDIRKSVDQDESMIGSQEPVMHEVRCFIQAGDDDLINILSSKDTTSLYSVKNDSTHFETIEENSGSPSNSRASSRTSRRSLEPKSPTESVVSLKDRQRKEKEQKMKLQPPINEVNYAVIAAPVSKAEERKASVPTSRKQPQKDQARTTTSQERS